MREDAKRESGTIKQKLLSAALNGFHPEKKFSVEKYEIIMLNVRENMYFVRLPKIV
jgi:hypothetical protein